MTWIHGSWPPINSWIKKCVRHQRCFWPTGSANVTLGSPGSFSSLFCSASEQETASNTSLTPTFLLSFGDAEQKKSLGSMSIQGQLLLIGVLASFKNGKLTFYTTEGHILLTIIKYNLKMYRMNKGIV